MATWKKVVLSGSAAELSSLSLGTALPATSGGTGFSSYTTGDLLYANSTTSLVKLGIGSVWSSTRFIWWCPSMDKLIKQEHLILLLQQQLVN
jgi:hypothetical protein